MVAREFGAAGVGLRVRRRFVAEQQLAERAGAPRERVLVVATLEGHDQPPVAERLGRVGVDVEFEPAGTGRNEPVGNAFHQLRIPG